MEKGRPSDYTKEKGDYICEQIATTSNGLVFICKKEGMPNPSTVYRWIKDNEDFRNNYARAREQQADLLADEIIELADKERRTKTIGIGGEGGGFETEQDNHARTRIQIDARKWKASKLYPKKYGEKIDVTSDNKPITTQIFKIGDQEIEL